jgi:hypothetical protein
MNTLKLTEIRARLDGAVEDKMDCGARRPLGHEPLEAAVWVEPLPHCYEIDSTEDRFLYIAGVNYMYETVILEHSIAFQKNAVSLHGYCPGRLIVPWGIGDELYGLNFDRWKIVVNEPGLRDDCVGTWKAQVRSRSVGEITVTRLGTK